MSQLPLLLDVMVANRIVFNSTTHEEPASDIAVRYAEDLKATLPLMIFRPRSTYLLVLDGLRVGVHEGDVSQQPFQAGVLAVYHLVTDD